MYRSISMMLTIVLAAPAASAFAGESQGFLYGKVKARSGTVYEGRLRWNTDEEAFWGDLFNGTKDDLPYMSERRNRDDDDGEINIFGIRIRGRSDRWGGGGRSFVSTFGDIAKIEVIDDGEAVLTMKSGSEIELDGGSNDVDARITVWDREIGAIDLEWDRIDTIEFSAAPADLDPGVFRLHGKVETDQGDFEGFIQWDKEECVSDDELDGESDDGDLSIKMGQIRSIERRSRSSSTVVLKSGREFVLSGSNDVDDDNRGIYVENPSFGRVLVTWDAFERVTFSDPGSSGPAYDDFKPGTKLRGTVTVSGGASHSGQIVFDLDEEETWEHLNGYDRDLEYTIPFGLIRSLERRSSDSCRLTLRSGDSLTLEGDSDVGGSNAGVLILSGGERTYVEWDDVERIDFD